MSEISYLNPSAAHSALPSSLLLLFCCLHQDFVDGKTIVGGGTKGEKIARSWEIVGIGRAAETQVIIKVFVSTTPRELRMPDILWKWVIIGDSGVGKTSLLQRLCNGEFNNTFISTIGIDFKIKKMEVAGKSITVQIWDTAGQERFGTITKSCYRGSVGVILVYGVNDRNTYEDVNKWLNDIRLTEEDVHTGERVAKILLGNKSDLEAARAVSTEEGQALADQNEIPFMETSARSGKNVDDAFMTLARVILGEGPQQGSSSSKKSSNHSNSASQLSSSMASSSSGSYFSFFKAKEESLGASPMETHVEEADRRVISANEKTEEEDEEKNGSAIMINSTVLQDSPSFHLADDHGDDDNRYVMDHCSSNTKNSQAKKSSSSCCS